MSTLNQLLSYLKEKNVNVDEINIDDFKNYVDESVVIPESDDGVVIDSDDEEITIYDPKSKPGILMATFESVSEKPKTIVPPPLKIKNNIEMPKIVLSPVNSLEAIESPPESPKLKPKIISKDDSDMKSVQGLNTVDNKNMELSPIYQQVKGMPLTKDIWAEYAIKDEFAYYKFKRVNTIEILCYNDNIKEIYINGELFASTTTESGNEKYYYYECTCPDDDCRCPDEEYMEALKSCTSLYPEVLIQAYYNLLPFM